MKNSKIESEFSALNFEIFYNTSVTLTFNKLKNEN